MFLKLKQTANISLILIMMSFFASLASAAATPAETLPAARINNALSTIAALRTSLKVPNITIEFHDQLAHHLDIVVAHIEQGELAAAQRELLGFMGTLTANSYQILGKEDSLLLDALYLGADLVTYDLAQALQARPSQTP